MINLFGILLVIFLHMTPQVSPVTMTPQVNVTTEHVTVTEGKRATLPCTVDLEDQEVIWVNPRKILISLHDRRIIDDHRISVERPFIKVWNLLIRTVRYNDSGIYECRINTTPRQIKKVRLEVQVPPSILSQLSSDKVTVTEGETATIICNVTGIPQPNVTWYKRNYRTIGGEKERIGDKGEILMIKNISRHCDDIYECLVDNKVPPAVSKAIRVVVEFSPEVVVPKPQRIGQRLHKETILECQIYANPQGVTTWMRHGRELQKMTNYNKYDVEVIHNDMESSITLALRIRDLSDSDYGPYECVGSNYIGEDRETMIIYEIKPPPTTTTTTTTTTTPALIHVHPQQHHQNKDHGFNNNNNNYNNYDDNNNDNFNNRDDDNNVIKPPNSDHYYHGSNDDTNDKNGNNVDSRYDRVRGGNNDQSWPGVNNQNSNNNDDGSATSISSSLWIISLLVFLISLVYN